MMLIGATSLLVLLSGPQQTPRDEPAPVQGPPAPVSDVTADPAAADPETAWEPMDEVQLIVNDAILTQVDIVRLLERERLRRGITTERQFREAQQRILVAQTDAILSAQAGHDLKIDPALIKKEVEDKLDRAVELHGVHTIAKDLERQERDSGEIKRELEDDIYREFWERVATGLAVEPGGRVSKDRFVRPGFLRFSYDRLAYDPELLEDIGGKPELVVLQELLLSAEGAGGLEGSFRRAQQIALRAREGVDFTNLVEQFSSQLQNSGMLEPIAVAEVARSSPRIAQWLGTVEVGSISDPTPIEREGRVLGWRVMKLVERRTAVVPLFHEEGVQRRIQETVLRRQDEFWLHQALNKLYAGAFIWPEEIPKQRPPIPPRVPEGR